MSKKYVVVGNHAVDGHEPGEEFVPDRDRVKWLVQAGHIAPAVSKSTKADIKATKEKK